VKYAGNTLTIRKTTIYKYSSNTQNVDVYRGGGGDVYRNMTIVPPLPSLPGDATTSKPVFFGMLE
jgi:hypothetical protein